MNWKISLFRPFKYPKYWMILQIDLHLPLLSSR